jgi:hypothetical protein
MAAISTTRAAIQTGINSTIRAYAYSPESLNPPCAVVGFPSAYDVTDTLSDTATLTIPVELYVPYSSNRAAEDNLEAYLASSGAGSVITAIEALGSNYAVVGVRDFGVTTNAAGQPTALGCTLDVLVYA